MRSLCELLAGLGGRIGGPPAVDAPVTGITADSRAVVPGHLFVALPGTRTDGGSFIHESVRRGAVAVVAEKRADIGERGEDDQSARPPVPLILVDDARAALADLAAAWYGHPGDRLTLVGITGSLGKTSTLSMLHAILEAAGLRFGTIGSLGIRIGDEVRTSRLTTPGPLRIHRALDRFLACGARGAAMEVTSHALDQRRIHGLEFGLGIFTNLVPLEHRDYHGSFRAYVEAKRRFFDHLRPGARLVRPSGDRGIASLCRGRAVFPVLCGRGGHVTVRIDRLLVDRGGTRVTLAVRSALSTLDGRTVPPGRFPVELRVLGRPNVANALLAAAAGLCLGAETDTVADALSRFPAPWRRMQIVHRGRFTVLDDTVGHPDSISAVFDVAGRIPHRRLHVVYAIRGRRGEEINRRDAETIAIWARRVPIRTLFVTASRDATDEVDRVAAGERDVFLATLRRYGMSWEYREALESAVGAALDAAGDRDLILLLGAQGMDRGGELVRSRVA